MAGRRRSGSGADPGARLDAHCRQVADGLIRQIKDGTAPWVEAWKPGVRALPDNVRTGKPYRGCNSVWLAAQARERGFGDHRWGTFRQVQEMGGHVRRGERGSQIVYWQFEAKERLRDANGRPAVDPQGEPLYRTRPLAAPRVRTYTVFNAEQCGGLPARERAVGQSWSAHAEAERILHGSGARIEHTSANRAYYDMSRDRIILPQRDQFRDAGGYYQTALHELGHWSGHPDRLNRPTLIRGMEYGELSQDYAREELRAEISSLITGDRVGVGHDPARHAAYVDSWVKALHDDPREIYRATKDAQDISDFTLDRVRERTGQREPGSAETVRTHGREPDRDVGKAPVPPPAPEVGGQYRLFQRDRQRSAPGR